jgi:hypothetical protein
MVHDSDPVRSAYAGTSWHGPQAYFSAACVLQRQCQNIARRPRQTHLTPFKNRSSIDLVRFIIGRSRSQAARRLGKD